MSFFDEPPPLDCDLPPPLDDKLKENYFDLEEEEIIIEDNRISDLPELPTDFNIFSSVSTDDSISYSHPPPELPEYEIPASPPPDGTSVGEKVCDPSESPEKCDVAKEKESSTIDEVVLQHEVEVITVGDKARDELSSSTPDENYVVTRVSVTSVESVETLNVNTAVDDQNIPSEKDDEVKVYLQSNEFTQPEVIVDDVSEPRSEVCEGEDDFNDFVEAGPGDETIEPSEAFKTAEFLGNDSDFDDFAGFTTHCDDIPEPIPELNLDDDDDDFDDFNDFKTAIPAHRQVESVKDPSSVVAEAPAEIEFEADFSGFNAFSQPAEEPSFAEFQAFKETGFESDKATADKLDSHLQEDDEDDDFGDFSAPVALPEAQPVALVKPRNVGGILDMMFPPTSSCSSEKIESFDEDSARDQQVIKSDNFVHKFNDFDSTLALGYHYSNSKASQTIVKALGIDTRNILLGPQWNSSSSNMPRFAANLSFSPIEPLKPSASQSSSVQSSTEPTPSILQPTKVATDTVPEVEFDWNSSGLVNPLDGPQPKPKQPLDGESILVQPPAPPTYSVEDESSFHVVDKEVAQVFEAEAKAHAGHKSELSDTSAYQWSSEHHVGPFGSTAPSSSILVRERTIKLPETHIFTPVKGSSPVAREVTSRDGSPTAELPKGSIVVKEYHDVEYSLEPKKKIETDNDFDDFQSAEPQVIKPIPLLVPMNLLELKKVKKSTEIKWPEPGSTTQVASNDLYFLEPAPTAPMKIELNLPLAPSTLIPSKRKDQDFAKPVIGTSPTEHNGTTGDDDDFNDFQAAPLSSQVQPPKPLQSNDPITLSPARLVAQQSQQHSTWISSIDNDEMSRFEAAFPRCKTEKKSAQRANDDDDWCDFVGVTQPPTSLPPAQPKLPSMVLSNTMVNLSRQLNGDNDDWSDFVSVPPPKIPSSRSSGAISSQFQSKPNFAAWNQPSSKPYVNHTTSFLTNESKLPSQPFQSANYPFVTDRPSMTITNNFAYNFNASANHHQQRPNGISTILPELDFAMPKNLINLPRSGNDPGKK